MRYGFAQNYMGQYIQQHGDVVENPNGKKPLKLTIQRFANLHGFQLWREFRDYIEDTPVADLINGVSELDEKLQETLKPLLLEEITKNAQSTKELLGAYHKLGLITSADYEHFNTNRYTDLPVSLRQKLIEIFESTNLREKLKISINDAKFMVMYLWDKLAFDDKLYVFRKLSVNNVELAYHQFEELWNEASDYLTDLKNTPNWLNLGDFVPHIKSLLAQAVKRKLVTIEELLCIREQCKESRKNDGEYRSYHYYYHKGVFGEMDSTPNKIDALIWLFGDSEDLSGEDIEVLKFYREYCVPAKIGSTSERSNSLESINAILRSKSVLAAPVLATYMLFNYGSDKFSIERLYAIFYYLNKYPALQVLIDKLEPLATIERDFRYTQEHLQNELIAATVLTRVADSGLRGNQDQFNSYLDVLRGISEAGHYHLILKECSRFIDITELMFSPTVFQYYLEEALANINESQIERLSQKERDGIYLLAARMNVELSRIQPYVGTELKQTAKIFSNPDILRVLEARHSREKYSQGMIKVMEVFGCSLNHYVNFPGAGRMLDYQESIIQHLLDVFLLSNPMVTSINPNRVEISVNKRLATLLKDKERYHYGRRSRLDHLIVPSESDVEFMPKKMQGLYKKLSSVIHQEVLYSNQVLAKLHLEKVEAKNVVYMTPYSFVTLVDGKMTIYGEVESQQAVFNLLTEFKPTSVATIDLERLWFHDFARENHNHGYIQYDETEVEFENMAGWDKDTIIVLNEAFEHLNLQQYKGTNPLEVLSYQLSPKFEFMGVQFNKQGTEYF